MKISIIVPVYNEEKTVAEVLEVLEKLQVEKEIIVVDDGSIDGTRGILDGIAGKYHDIKLVFHEVNKGKGGAIHTGIENMSGDIMCIQDADLEYDPNEIPVLLKSFEEDPSLDAVYGSRFMRKNPNIYRRFLLGNKVLTGLTNLLHGTRYTDSYTCYKFIKKDVVKKLDIRSTGFEMEAEISIKLKKMGFKVK